jgi:predicted nucleic acid-binding protein
VALILDTGPLFALLDRRDNDHEPCRRLIGEMREPRVIPAPVIVELDQLVRARIGATALLPFLDDLADSAYFVENLIPEDYRRARELCDRYADSDIGFVDAAVLAIVERLNEPKLATLDHRHFGLLRPRHVDALLLLPE